MPSTAAATTAINYNNLVKQLQEELSNTKEHLIDQQTKYLLMQTKHRQEIDETTQAFNNANREFQLLLRQQKEEFKLMFEQQAKDYEFKLNKKIKELEVKHALDMKNKLDDQFVQIQEKLIVSYESQLQDFEIKIKKIINQTIREEQIADKNRLKQSLEQIESQLKLDTEKFVQNYFKSQSEIFKVLFLRFNF